MFSFLKLLSKFPLRLLYAISSVLWFPVSRLYRRKLVLQNLHRVFPNKSTKELNAIADKFYRHFIDTTIEILKVPSIRAEELKKRVSLINPEIAFEQQSKNKPLLMVGGHQCNWEWLGLALGFHMTIPADVIYKPLQNKKADKYMYDIRSKFGGRPISKDKGAREILKLKNEHCIIGLVADQSPPRDHVYWAKLFGIESDFYPGLVQLPYMLQVPVVFGRPIRVKRGYYQLEMVKIGEPPYKKGDYTILKNFIRETERLIEEYPEDYLWTHNRWKHTRNENEEIINFSQNNPL